MNVLHSILAQTDPNRATFFLPRRASNLAVDVDWAWNVILGITTVFFAIIVVAMIIFLIKYRRRTPNDRTSEITHNTPLEIVWTVIPLILVMAIFLVGFKGFLNYDTPPSNAVVIDLEGRRWSFTFTYPNGATSADLYLMKDVPVRLDLHSTDVLHAFFVPAFRTQRNLIAGRYTNMWFIPTEKSPDEGFDAFCTQYCGQNHSKMGARVFVFDDRAKYEKKMTELANPFKQTDAAGKSTWVPYVKVGEKLYTTSGCAGCHSVNGDKGTGPTWKDLWKRDHQFAQVNEPGYALKASDPDEKWEAYLHESVIHPEAKIVEGFQNVMPNFAPRFEGEPGSPNDEKLRAIIAYIKSVGNQNWKPDTNPTDNADLYDADHPKLLDAQGLPVHPESLMGIKCRQTGNPQSQPGK